jgi:chromosomal replication initiation ATPase DnaA
MSGLKNLKQTVAKLKEQNRILAKEIFIKNDTTCINAQDIINVIMSYYNINDFNLFIKTNTPCKNRDGRGIIIYLLNKYTILSPTKIAELFGCTKAMTYYYIQKIEDRMFVDVKFYNIIHSFMAEIQKKAMSEKLNSNNS